MTNSLVQAWFWEEVITGKVQRLAVCLLLTVCLPLGAGELVFGASVSFRRDEAAG
jgi:hypothetical protein